MALAVSVSGAQNADRNDRIDYTAIVTGNNGRTVVYAWSSTHGSFVGATDAATATWEP